MVKEERFNTSDWTPVEKFMAENDIQDIKTVHRMQAEGELPPFTYGVKGTAKKKGWHNAVLEAHSLRRYEDFRNAS